MGWDSKELRGGGLRKGVGGWREGWADKSVCVPWGDSGLEMMSETTLLSVRYWLMMNHRLE